jgi:SAM-dependent methyltransferase
MATLTYNPRIFDAGDIASAMAIILTPEDSTTAKRWATETPYLTDLISRTCGLTEQSVVLDFGCGIGRLAKELIARHQCRVVGVDTSANMRALAPIYVASDRFLSCSPEMLDLLIERGMHFDTALSVWVLQHCLHPAAEIARIHRALNPGGGLFVVNQRNRAVPTVESGWVNDGMDIQLLLSDKFVRREEGPLSPEMTTATLSKEASWVRFQREI